MTEPQDDFVDPMKWLDVYRKEPNLKQYPLLYLLLLEHANAHQWSSQQFRFASQLDPQAFLTALDLPCTKENSWVLEHACIPDEDFDTPWAFEVMEIKALYLFFKHNTASQLHRSCIPKAISRMLSLAVLLDQYPELITARFIKPRPDQKVTWSNDLQVVRRIHRLAQRLKVTHLNRRIRRCRDNHELRLLLSKLEHQAYDHILNNLALVDLDDLDCVLQCMSGWLEAFEQEQLKIHWFDDYGPSPLPGNANLIPLRSYQSVFLEALTQHHCATLHHGEMLDNEYVLFSVWSPERATLGLVYNQDKHCYEIDQLLLKDNKPVAEATEREIKRWLKQIQQLKTCGLIIKNKDLSSI